MPFHKKIKLFFEIFVDYSLKNIICACVIILTDGASFRYESLMKSNMVGQHVPNTNCFYKRSP